MRMIVFGDSVTWGHLGFAPSVPLKLYRVVQTTVCNNGGENDRPENSDESSGQGRHGGQAASGAGRS